MLKSNTHTSRPPIQDKDLWVRSRTEVYKNENPFYRKHLLIKNNDDITYASH